MTSGEGGRILVVDDDPGIQEVVRVILEISGYTVRVATDGQQAVDLFKEFIPDLVITDIAMPRGDGFNVALYIRSLEAAQGRRIPILLMSAFYEEEANRDNMERCGADGFLPKPFTKAQLTGAVERLLRGESLD